MPVSARGNSWQATVTHKGRRFRKDFPTRAEAELWEADSKARLLRGELPNEGGGKAGTGKPMTLQELLDYTYTHAWRGKPAERVLHMNGLACVAAIGASLAVTKIDTKAIDNAVLVWERMGNSNGTINRKLAAISKMLTEAKRAGVIANVPYIRRRKEAEARLRFYSEEEERHILLYFLHMGNANMHDLCAVAIDTGCRLGELLALLPGDVQGKWLRLDGARTKNKRARDIPLTARALRILVTRGLAVTNIEDKRLFPLTSNSVHHYWVGLRAHMSMEEDPQFVFHVFRHTFCSRLVQRGVQIQVVQKLAGHETITITMRYAKLAPKNLADAIKVLDGGMAEPVLEAAE